MTGKPMTLVLSQIPTPIGNMIVVADDRERVRALDWEDYSSRMQELLRRHYGHDVEIRRGSLPRPVQLAIGSYLDGDLDALTPVAVETAGTEFQRTVWSALRRIPPGTTSSYGALAAAIGRPTAMRAVGLANGANPIGVIVPCHRVIGTDGSLTGFGGGLPRKRWLLEHEGICFDARNRVVPAPRPREDTRCYAHDQTKGAARS